MIDARHRTLAFGLGVIALANGIALGGVVYNRIGEPTSTLVVSDREIRLPWYDEKENSGLTVQLAWCVTPLVEDESQATRDPGCWDRRAAWADGAKLLELGFPLDVDPRTADAVKHYSRASSRPVFLAMELDGPTYRTVVARAVERARVDSIDAAQHADSAPLSYAAKSSRTARENLEQNSTRLFIVDAARDAGALRAKYPDRTRYAILRGTMQPTVEYRDKRIMGEIDVQGTGLTIPHALRPLFVPRTRSSSPGGIEGSLAPTRITVGFGRRFEPFIIEAKKPAP